MPQKARLALKLILLEEASLKAILRRRNATRS